ncbi:7TMR-DISM family protein [Persicobacter diffluens]|uniref:7TM-DISM receptor extracellular domain-containing protein n=1 Tax=Persicobacter diffluens TaxID=981 RepID=A0AAN5APK0_9BACT|nr:hypothetical protein PEDI_49580 [Persicobacter diffluens]
MMWFILFFQLSLFSQPEIVISNTQIGYYIDESNAMEFEEINKPELQWQHKLDSNKIFYINDNAVTYWLRFPIPDVIQHNNVNYYLEITESHLNQVSAWVSGKTGATKVGEAGFFDRFPERQIPHKNFVYGIPDKNAENYIFKVNSRKNSSFIPKFRSIHFLFQYTLSEYFYLGIYYGLIGLIALFNLIAFIFLRQKKYYYLSLLFICGILLSTKEDSLFFQFFWPEFPGFNYFVYFFSYSVYTFYLISFILTNLNTPGRWLKSYQLLMSIYLGTLIFKDFFNGGTINFITWAYMLPLVLILVKIFKSKIEPTPKFIMAIALVMNIIVLVPKLDFFKIDSIFVLYSFNFLLLIQGVLFTIVLVLDYKWSLAKARNFQESLMAELKHREAKISQQVHEKTSEIESQKIIISEKNLELSTAYKELYSSNQEVSRLNEILQNQNVALIEELNTVTQATIHSKPVSFSSFQKQFPNEEVCYQFIFQVKSRNGYVCEKCQHQRFTEGSEMELMQCAKCQSEVSITRGTIFHRLKMDLAKAFYITFYVTTMGEDFNVSQLAESLALPTNTCWRFVRKVADIRYKKQDVKNGSWEELILL